MFVNDVYDYLSSVFPVELKQSWDNCGKMLFFDNEEVSGIYISLDFSFNAVKYAEMSGCNCIVTHHPAVFSPLTHLSSENFNERALLYAAEKRISIISMHTNMDTADGGVNDALAKSLDLPVAEKFAFEEGKSLGRICIPNIPLSTEELIKKIKKKLLCDYLQFCGNTGHTAAKIAIVSGAGGDFIGDAVKAGCDTYITGEIKHHQWAEASAFGINCIAAGHYETEFPIVAVLEKLISERFSGIAVVASRYLPPYLYI